MGANAPGELIHAITTAVLASFIVTWVLLAGYRRAVSRTMRTASAQAERAPSPELPVAPSSPLVRAAIAPRLMRAASLSVMDSTTDRVLVESSLDLTSGASEQPAWIMMKREAAAMPVLWRELAQRAGVAPAAAI